MSSQRRIEASRANGARSRGPVTVEGKQRSAANATRHGLLAHTVLLPDEDEEAFQEMLAGLVAHFRPVGAFELSLVEEMAAAQWRMRRAWAIESRMLDAAASGSNDADPVDRITHAFSSLAAGPELTLMHRYETRQSRIFQRALNNLLRSRKENLPNEPNPNSEHGHAMDLSAEPPPPAREPEPPPPAPPAHPAPSPGIPQPPAACDPFDLLDFDAFDPNITPRKALPRS